MSLTWFKWRYFIYLLVVVLWFIWFTNIKVSQGESYIAADCKTMSKDYGVAMVLGARVIGGSEVSQVYADRLQTAVNLYSNGSIKKIIVSGDHGQITYDEVNAGKDYLLAAGVSASDIFLDHAGFDTYDSIYRAKNIFKLDKVLIITQHYHLARALYLAKEINLNALGCEADLHEYADIGSMKRREILAKVKAWLDISYSSSPKYMGATIDINGSGEQTWDIFSY